MIGYLRLYIPIFWYMVGVPGFWARFLIMVFGQVFEIGKYSVQFYSDGNIQFYSSTGTEKSYWKTMY